MYLVQPPYPRESLDTPGRRVQSSTTESRDAIRRFAVAVEEGGILGKRPPVCAMAGAGAQPLPRLVLARLFSGWYRALL